MSNISIGKLKGGFCVYWRDADNVRRRYMLKARTREEAQGEAIDVYRQRNLKVNGSTIKDCWESYRSSLGDRPTARTLSYTGKAVLKHFGHLRPDQCSREICLEYNNARTQEDISQGSVHTELGHLRSCLRYAEKIGLIAKAPYIWRPSKPTPKERFLTHEEITSLINSCTAPHIRLAVVLLLGTAGRVGAILDLTWDRVDFDRGTINLRLSDSVTRKGRAILPMNGMTRAALQSAYDYTLSNYVVEYGGSQVRSIRKGFTGACERAQLTDVTIHTLRHSAAVHMVSAGVPMHKVSQYLGHSNTAITEKVYARYSPSHMQDAADVLNFTQLKGISK